MTLPNFLLIGAAKAGTTSLYHYLNQHPQIYMSPVKEPRFFAPEFYHTNPNAPIRKGSRQDPLDIQEYEALFEGATHEIAIGEASTEYLFFPKTAHRIKRHLPNAKLIAILRDPVERAFSAFCYQVRDNCEFLSFEQALQQETKRIQEKWRPGWLYLTGGFYYTQLKQYFDVFDRHQIKIYLYSDLCKNSQAVAQDIYRFLGVDDRIVPDTSKKNISVVPRNKFLHRCIQENALLKSAAKTILPEFLYQGLAQSIKTYTFKEKPALPPNLKQDLIKVYRDDRLKLEELIQRDLSHWLT